MTGTARPPRPGRSACAVLLLLPLLTGCLFTGGGEPAPPSPSADDGRFAPFTEKLDTEVEVRTNLDSVSSRMPGVRPRSATWAAAYRPQGLSLPEKRSYWFHAVITPEPRVVSELEGTSTGPVDTLPGLFEPLRAQVPTSCRWMELDSYTATRVLIPHPTPRFGVQQAALSPDCGRLIVVGNGE